MSTDRCGCDPDSGCVVWVVLWLLIAHIAFSCVGS